MEKFYLVQAFSKVRNLVEISKISKNLEILKILSGEAPALRFIRAGTRLTVHRSLRYQNSIELGQSGAAHADARNHENHVLENIIIDKMSWESNNNCRYCIEDLDRADNIDK